MGRRLVVISANRLSRDISIKYQKPDWAIERCKSVLLLDHAQDTLLARDDSSVINRNNAKLSYSNPPKVMNTS